MKCRICSNSLNNQSYFVKEMMFGLRHVFEYFQCSECHCLQIKEEPKDMREYYPEQYYSFSNSLSGINKIEKNRLKIFLRQQRSDYLYFNENLFNKIINRIMPSCWVTDYEEDRKFLVLLKNDKIEKQARILDIGCGAGRLISIMRYVGYENVVGIDPYIDKDVVYANGVKVLKREVRDIKQKFDLIMLNHSLEHMPEQTEVFRQLYYCLEDTGTLLIRIPIASSYAWEHYKENWVELDAPRHFYLHSINSLGHLCGLSGFKIRKIIYDSLEFEIWGSEQYVRDIPLMSEKSYFKNKGGSIFAEKDIVSFRDQVEKLNIEGRGCRAAFFIEKQHCVPQ